MSWRDITCHGRISRVMARYHVSWQDFTCHDAISRDIHSASQRTTTQLERKTKRIDPFFLTLKAILIWYNQMVLMYHYRYDYVNYVNYNIQQHITILDPFNINSTKMAERLMERVY